MWDTLALPARGNFSLRQIARTFLAAILSAFLLAIMNTAVTHAADATWQDDGSIKYNDKTYTQQSPVPNGVTAPEGAAVYIYKDEQAKTASVLTIPANTDQTKEMRDIEVTEYVVAQDGTYTNPTRAPNPITLDAKPESKNKTQCDVAGIGWIICVTSRFLAEGMDNIFDIIADYLKVEPITTNTDSGLYKAWSVALGIANLMFVLAFLVMIYSYLTSAGMNNYNVKKMIPKLIIAAVLVNISYYICAIAVDISNVLGYSVQEALVQVRKSLPDPTSQISWSDMTTYILSGGTIVAGGVGAVVGLSAVGGVAGLSYLLFIVLVSGALAVLVALLILAARQALIVVLIVVAPLAFVAYLLPNTEKWFEKWRDLFMTMLLVFPLFSLLFGGSQLASYIVIQNTKEISVVIFAMFIQVAPLVMTPFLVKFSGSLLGRLAGMVNDPRKGIVDRTRNWANDRADIRKKAMASNGETKPFFTPSRMAYKREMSRRNREGLKAMYDNEADASWHGDKRYNAMDHRNRRAADIKKTIESNHERDFEQYKATNPTMQRYVGQQRLNQDTIKSLQTAEEAAWERAKTGEVEPGNQFTKYSQDARAVLRNQDIAQRQVKLAQSVQSDAFTKNALANEAVQQEIGIVGGAERALANISAEYRKNYNERVAEGEQLLKHFNLSGPERQKLALGQTVTVSDAEGNLRVFRPDQQYIREASIDVQMRQGTLAEAEQIIEQSGVDLKNYSTTIAQAMAERKISGMAVYLGGQTINDVGQGKVAGSEGLDRSFVTTLLKGKVSAHDLATGDADGLKRMFRVLNSGPPAYLSQEKQADFVEKSAAFKQAAYNALTDGNLKGNVRDNSKEVLVQALRTLGGEVRESDGSIVSDLGTRSFS